VIQIDRARIGIFQLWEFRVIRVEVLSSRRQRFVAGSAVGNAYGSQLRLDALMFDMATRARADGCFLAVPRPVVARQARLIGNQHPLRDAAALGDVAEFAMVAEGRMDTCEPSGAVGLVGVPDMEREHPQRGHRDRGEREVEPPSAHPLRALEVIHVNAAR